MDSSRCPVMSAILVVLVLTLPVMAIECVPPPFEQETCKAVLLEDEAIGMSYKADLKDFSADLGMKACPSFTRASTTAGFMGQTHAYLTKKELLLCILGREFDEVRYYAHSLCSTCEDRIEEFRALCRLGTDRTVEEFKETITDIDPNKIDVDAECADPDKAVELYRIEAYGEGMNDQMKEALCLQNMERRVAECKNRLDCVKESCGIGGTFSLKDWWLRLKGTVSDVAKDFADIESFCEISRELKRSTDAVDDYLENMHDIALNLKAMVSLKKKFDIQCRRAPFEEWPVVCRQHLSDMAGLQGSSKNLMENYKEADNTFKQEFGYDADVSVKTVLCDRMAAARHKLPDQQKLTAQALKSMLMMDCGNKLSCLIDYEPGPKTAACETAPERCGGCDVLDSFGICTPEHVPDTEESTSNMYLLIPIV